jgi:alkylated DNA nucleotide flippase Atl1
MTPVRSTDSAGFAIYHTFDPGSEIPPGRVTSYGDVAAIVAPLLTGR